MKENSKGIRHFIAAFRYSMSGLRMALGETAVRQELVLGVANLAALILLPLSPAVRIALFALWMCVLIVELLNTAVEAVVDLVSPDFHELAKRAKDLCSAAVFLSLTAFFSVWVYVIVLVIMA